MKNKYLHGFTLIELMIVVAVIGILAAVAIPSYQESIRKGKRAEGRAALTELMLQQERYFTQNNTYLAFTNTAGTTSPVVAFKTFSGDSSSKTSYYLNAAACTSSTIKECVVVTAVPTFTDSDAGSLQVLSSGTKTCTGAKPSVCWK